MDQELHQEPAADLGMLEIQGRLRQLEQRDLWLWGAAIVVMLLLILAVVSFSLPALAQEESPFSVHHLDQAVQGLLGLVLLFSIHVIYQLILVRRLRRQLARQLEIIARQELRTEQLRQLVLTDPLTGLYNRRFLEQHLVVEIARSRRQDYLLSVLMLDLNDFKQINDCYGHSAGDLVLTHFAIHIRKAIRSSDIPVRMGGDEFLVLLPECRPEQVLSVLSRLHGLEVDHHGRKIPFAFSAGWAACQPDDAPKQVLERV
ncbi:MAG: GGDEF domain-containing protein, partial [Candidatus Acidiferrales bacterium]